MTEGSLGHLTSRKAGLKNMATLRVMAILILIGCLIVSGVIALLVKKPVILIIGLVTGICLGGFTIQMAGILDPQLGTEIENGS